MGISAHHLPDGVLLRHHRWRLERGEALPWHRHRFAEWFWIEQGTGLHQGPDGEETVGTGCLRFLAVDSVHRLHALGEPLVWCNVSIDPELYAHYHRRYAPTWQPWPWDRSDLTLDKATCRRLRLTLDGIPPLVDDPTIADRCFLDLRRILTVADSSLQPLPDWLRQALAVLRTDAGLEEGVPALVRASRRGQDHVARTVKRCFGVTPSLLVRKARLDAAAVRLRTGSEHILTIALACGFDNASYFTRAFRDRFGCTPRAYRNGTAAIGSEIAS